MTHTPSDAAIDAACYRLGWPKGSNYCSLMRDALAAAYTVEPPYIAGLLRAAEIAPTQDALDALRCWHRDSCYPDASKWELESGVAKISSAIAFSQNKAVHNIIAAAEDTFFDVPGERLQSAIDAARKVSTQQSPLPDTSVPTDAMIRAGYEAMRTDNVRDQSEQGRIRRIWDAMNAAMRGEAKQSPPPGTAVLQRKSPRSKLRANASTTSAF